MVVVVILAVGVPVIYYAVSSGDSAVAAKTIPTGQVVGQINHVEKADTPVKEAPPQEDSVSAKEMLAQMQNEPSAAEAVANDKVGYSLQYLAEQRAQEAQQTCQPLVDAAQKKLDDADAVVETKKKAYDLASDKLNAAIDSEDDSKIESARDTMEDAKKAYESALSAKFAANSELVTARIKCIY